MAVEDGALSARVGLLCELCVQHIDKPILRNISTPDVQYDDQRLFHYDQYLFLTHGGIRPSTPPTEIRIGVPCIVGHGPANVDVKVV